MIRNLHATRKLLLLVFDVLSIILAAYLGIYLEFYGSKQQIFSSHYYSVPLMIILFGLLFNVTNMFSLARKRFGEILLGIIINTLGMFTILMAVSFFFREFIYSRTVLAYSALLQIIFLSLVNYTFWRLERSLIIPKSLLIIGDDSECARIQSKIKLQSGTVFAAQQYCLDYQADWQKLLPEVDTIALANNLTLVQKEAILHFCHQMGKQILIFPSAYEVFCQNMLLETLDDVPVFKSNYLRPTLEQRSLKRIFDFTIALLAIIIFAPIMLLVAVAIYLDDPGKVIYTQQRVGRDEQEFTIVKFRSMRLDAERGTGPVLAKQDDDRITRIGAFIRRTRLDELPQLFNVLLGQMSLVGPRPERMYFVEQYKIHFPEYAYRHTVKPGITGMAQVYGKYNTTAYDKLIYDLMYIQKCNIFTDIIILIQTIKVLFIKSSTEGV